MKSASRNEVFMERYESLGFHNVHASFPISKLARPCVGPFSACNALPVLRGRYVREGLLISLAAGTVFIAAAAAVVWQMLNSTEG